MLQSACGILCRLLVGLQAPSALSRAGHSFWLCFCLESAGAEGLAAQELQGCAGDERGCPEVCWPARRLAVGCKASCGLLCVLAGAGGVLLGAPELEQQLLESAGPAVGSVHAAAGARSSLLALGHLLPLVQVHLVQRLGGHALLG